MGIVLRVKLDEILKKNEMTQKQLVDLIKTKTGKDVRAAAISELYNNQRKSLNKELIETIAEVLEITDISEFISLDKNNHQS